MTPRVEHDGDCEFSIVCERTIGVPYRYLLEVRVFGKYFPLRAFPMRGLAAAERARLVRITGAVYRIRAAESPR